MPTFISHSSHDAAFARELADLMRGAGLQPWLAEREIGPGQEYPDEIDRVLRKTCDSMVVLLSGPALRSAHVKSELRLAMEAGTRRLPVVVSDDGLPVHWPGGFRYLVGGSQAAIGANPAQCLMHLLKWLAVEAPSPTGSGPGRWTGGTTPGLPSPDHQSAGVRGAVPHTHPG